jgi:hypothetical protein
LGSLNKKFGTLDKRVIFLDRKLDLTKNELLDKLDNTKDLLIQEDRASEKRMMAKIDFAKDEVISATGDQIDGNRVRTLHA